MLVTGNSEPQPITTQNQVTMPAVTKEGNFVAGISGGVIAAIIGAILWGIISIWIERQIGWMAIGVGALVGLGVRIFGKGTSAKFGIVGAILAILGCLAGNVVMIYIAISREYGLGIWEVVTNLSLKDVFEIQKELFELIDILFYALALYAGYRFSFRKTKSTEKSG
jgi:hypothetical protein